MQLVMACASQMHKVLAKQKLHKTKSHNWWRIGISAFSFFATNEQCGNPKDNSRWTKKEMVSCQTLVCTPQHIRQNTKTWKKFSVCAERNNTSTSDMTVLSWNCQSMLFSQQSSCWLCHLGQVMRTAFYNTSQNAAHNSSIYICGTFWHWTVPLPHSVRKWPCSVTKYRKYKYYYLITPLHVHKIKKLFQCIQFRTLSGHGLREKAANDWWYP